MANPAAPEASSAFSSASSAEAVGEETKSPRRRSVKRKEKVYVQDSFFVTRMIMESKEGSVLKAWFRHFDLDSHNCRCDYEAFKAGMLKLSYPGSVDGLWDDMVLDDSGELSFEELDEEGANLWMEFRRWAGSRFGGPRDVVRQLKRSYLVMHGRPPERNGDDVSIKVEVHRGRNRAWLGPETR